MLRRRTTSGLTTLVLVVTLSAGAAACGDDDAGDSSELSPAAVEGRQIALRAGCAACHGSDGDGGTGPAWAGSFGSEVELADGTTVTVDEAYLARSITDPGAQIHDGFAIQMPENQLTDEEIAKVVAYIVELNGAASAEEAGE